MRTTRASSAPAAPCADDAGLCWLGGSLSFFEEHTTAVCAIARLHIQRRRLLRLPTITTLRGRRRGAAESATRKCPSFGALVLCIRGNGVIHRGHKPIQGDDNGILGAKEGSPWLQSATTAAQLISKPSRRDEPQPGYRPAQLCAAAHPGRPRPHRVLQQLFRRLMSAYCFPEVRSPCSTGFCECLFIE